MQTVPDETIREIGDLAGIYRHYLNAFRNEVTVPITATLSLLEALGLSAADPASARHSRAFLQKRAEALVDLLVVVDVEAAASIPVRSPADEQVSWELVSENGHAIEGRSGVVIRNRASILELPALALGYHRLTLRAGRRRAHSTVICAPRRCWRPEIERQRWGLTGPVYGLVSNDNIGIGDFSDVATLAEAAAERGANFLGLSPLHALVSYDRQGFSPYSPSSRLFLDPIYIDPMKIHGFESLARKLTEDMAVNGRLAAVRDGRLVDYAEAWDVKESILRAIWRAFNDEGGSLSFDLFRRERGEALARHAAFEAAADADSEPTHLNATGSTSDRTTVTDSALFRAWLQWLADIQLAQASKRAAAGGMDIGIVTDFAVGASPVGSEVWATPEAFIGGVSIGAPPDRMARNGQNWGLRAFSPLAMQDDGMWGFRSLVAANMRHAGGIRVDHAFQIRRLFMIPNDQPAALGAYLAYPANAMLAVLRLESHRARCMVIGEDLGTAPKHFAETLESSGILGYRVLYFERDDDGDFVAPIAYPEATLAVVNTHDMATLEGWWRGQDIKDRLRFGLTDNSKAAEAEIDRQADRRKLVRALANQGLMADDVVPDEAPIWAVARLLARCSSELVSLQLDDIMGAIDQQNIPGVADGPPNWRRRLPMSITELARPGGPLDRLAHAMAAEGRTSRAAASLDNI